MQGRYNDTLYKREGEGVAAMKLKSTANNSRIYCKEIAPNKKGEKKKIIMSVGLKHKATQKNDKKIDSIIDSIQKYDYEYFETQDDAKKYRERTR